MSLFTLSSSKPCGRAYCCNTCLFLYTFNINHVPESTEPVDAGSVHAHKPLPQIESSSETTTQDNDTDLSNLPIEVQNKISKLLSHNRQLTTLCEKLDHHIQEQEEKVENMHQITEDLHSENKQLRDKLKTFALSSGQSVDDIEDLRKVNCDLEQDNNDLMVRLVSLEEEKREMTLEKQSLLSTLQLMQDELMVSEQQRRYTSTSNSLG